MKIAEAFNLSWFSRFINSAAGRVFRMVNGTIFLVIGYLFRDYTLGVISMVFGIFPASAGAFDICFISAALGGPLSGAKIRELQQRQ